MDIFEWRREAAYAVLGDGRALFIANRAACGYLMRPDHFIIINDEVLAKGNLYGDAHNQFERSKKCLI